jgi:hypothetical protein
MQDIAVYADKLGFDFETLLNRIAACDEKVFEHSKTKASGGSSVMAQAQFLLKVTSNVQGNS